jgi:hypothetical protein
MKQFEQAARSPRLSDLLRLVMRTGPKQDKEDLIQRLLQRFEPGTDRSG